jgi:pyridoxamine 5'-phosphate oxidase
MSNNDLIAGLRRDYRQSHLLESEVDSNPIVQFRTWFDHALKSEVNEPNAMCLSTVYGDRPDSRIVLLKGIEDEGFVFFTNYHSNKGLQIEANANVALNFVWLELERQVRIAGTAHKIDEIASDEYFYSRPFESQVGAIISEQSGPLASREVLEKAMEEALKKYRTEIPKRPRNWGGYIVVPEEIEFWQGRSSRLHDRLVYRKSKDNWQIGRLYP